MTIPGEQWWYRCGYLCRTIPADDGFWSGLGRPEQVKVSRRPLCDCHSIFDRQQFDDISDATFLAVLDEHSCAYSRKSVEHVAKQWQAADADPQ